MYSVKIHHEKFCSSCYFRSIAIPPYKKVLIQLTEKCNLRCKHCFVSSCSEGNEISYTDFKTILLPFLIDNNVKKVTLTGGEPFTHKRLLNIVQLLAEKNIFTSICSNATLITEEFVKEVADLNVHFNVSLDGYSHKSHGRFRGNEEPSFFRKIVDNIILLGRYELLNGILVTPNQFSSIKEYKQICEFAKNNGAKYVLMNPLSEFGRGQKSIDIAFTKEQMIQLRATTEEYASENFEMIYIRFPNDNKPLEDCIAGKINYVFANGDVTICPYMVFAANNKKSIYNPSEFIIGNILKSDITLEDSLFAHNFSKRTVNEFCLECSYSECKHGCLAAKISKGMDISGFDSELCPRLNFQ